MRTKIVAGNWKMHLDLEGAHQLSTGIVEGMKELKDSECEVILAPPFPFLKTVADIIPSGLNIAVAGQDMHPEFEGAFTGEVSGPMLHSVGCTYCIIGHSERRQYSRESDDLLYVKVRAALAARINPIFCVGESLEQRSDGEAFNHINRQLEKGLFGLDEEGFQSVVIAYEPIWAIGTGESASPEQAQEIHEFIRNKIADRYNMDIADETRILYGGSVKPENAEALFSQTDIDGGLVGGASLKSDSFIRIVETCS